MSQLSDIEKFVALRGALGCPLPEVPAHLLGNIDNTDTLEIICHCDSPASPEPIILNTPVRSYRLSQLSDYRGYVIRMSFFYWKQYILCGSDVRLAHVIQAVSLLVASPAGISFKLIKKLVPGLTKHARWCIRQLGKTGVITVKKQGGRDVLRFNFELVGGLESVPVEFFKGRPVFSTAVKATSQYAKAQLEAEGLSPSMIDTIERRIKKQKRGITVGRLRVWLKTNYDIVDKVVRVFDEMSEYDVVRCKSHATRIKYVGDDTTDYGSVKYRDPDSDQPDRMVNALAQMCVSTKVIKLGSLPKKIKRLKHTMRIESDEMRDLLANNGFSLIEIHSRYTGKAVIATYKDVSITDKMFTDAVQSIETRMATEFRKKIRQAFLRDSSMRPFDNNYIPTLKGRMLELYSYIVEQMKTIDGPFHLNATAISQMNFVRFAKCVPLRLEFQFIRTILEATQAPDPEADTNEAAGTEKQDKREICWIRKNFQSLNRECLERAANLTVSDVLERLERHSASYASLVLKVDVRELDREMHSIINYDIFRGAGDEQGYLIVERPSNEVEGRTRLLTREIHAPDDSVWVSYEERARFCERVQYFPQVNFYEDALRVIENEFEGEARVFLKKKLEGFNK